MLCNDIMTFLWMRHEVDFSDGFVHLFMFMVQTNRIVAI